MLPRLWRLANPITHGLITTILVVIVLMYAISLTVLPELTDTYPPPRADLKPWITGTAIGCWVVAAGLGLLVGWRTYRKNTRVEPAEPRCATCGYNLTGNVSGRCPECGERT